MVLRTVFLVCSFSILCFSGMCQNTVGVISYEIEAAEEGYCLLYPFGQSTVYLIDKCGRVVHEWTDDDGFVPGNSVYLLENGNLLKTKKPKVNVPGSFSNGGAGAIVELRSWDNTLLWSTEIANETFRAHHDVEMLPSGNVLIIVWQRRNREEFLQAGGDTTLYNRVEIWPDVIQEYDPVLDSIVWVWDSWNHLVQDYDPSRENYGDVRESKGKIDINYDRNGAGGRADWIHSNSIDYNEELDHILLSAAHFDELWIIDHSTSLEEAAGNSGGNSDRGGQLLFRWGNTNAYKAGGVTDKRLFFQHDAQWVDSPLLSHLDDFMQIAVFNNQVSGDRSSIGIIDPRVTKAENDYMTDSDGIFLPESFKSVLDSEEDYDFYSSSMSSVQLLPNGNHFVCASRKGEIYEISPENKLVWNYIVPFRNGFRIEQGSSLLMGDNVIFRAKLYHPDFSAFAGQDLTPQYYLELEPNELLCNIGTGVAVSDIKGLKMYPNPASDLLHITSTEEISSVYVYNSFGSKVLDVGGWDSGSMDMDISMLSEGLYYISIDNVFFRALSIVK